MIDTQLLGTQLLDTQPIGSPVDSTFLLQDLIDVAREFPSSQGAPYFANTEDTIICIPSVLNPQIQWCSTKTPATNPWATMAGEPFVHHTLVPPPSPPPHVPPIVWTPEPSFFCLLLFAFLVLVYRNWGTKV